MILRKPYAFLIKNFKLLHAVMTIFMMYILFRTLNVLKVFNDYFSSQVALIGTDASANTYTFLMFFISLIIIVFSVVLLWVMITKKKPSSLYVITIAVYIYTIIMFAIGRSTILNMEINVLDVRVIKLTRDLTTIAFILQIYPVLKSFVRAVGFDIKEFDFGKDLAELEISEADSEEFEVSVSFNANKMKRKINSKRREYKYIYKENKILINSVIFVFVLVIGLSIGYGIFLKEQKASMNSSFSVASFTFNITDAYVTRKNYIGNTLEGLNKDMSLVVIPFKAKNITLNDKGFLPSNVILAIGDHKFRTSIKYRDSIIDIASLYNGEELPSKEDCYKAFAFEVPTAYLNRAMTLKFVTSLSNKKNNVIPNYLSVPIKVVDLDDVKKSEPVTMGQEIDLSKTILDKSTLNISAFDIAKRFRVNYNYNIEEEDIPSYEYVSAPIESNIDRSLVRLTYSLTLDETKNIKNMAELINKYGSIRYTINGTVKEISNLNKAEPASTKLTKTLYVMVPDEVVNADEISLIIKIRNMEYVYKIR